MEGSRTTLTLRFWQHLMPDLRVVVCLRHPLDVARSLCQRNGTSVSYGLRLWHAYYEALAAAISPGHRIVTHYDRYFGQPAEELARVLDAAGLECQSQTLRAALGDIRPGVRHHHAASEADSGAALPEGLLTAYLFLCAEAQQQPARARWSSSDARSVSHLPPVRPAPAEPEPGERSVLPGGVRAPASEGTVPPDASLIIVTHDNLDYTRLCLHSVLTHTATLAIEVIVVDNASTDGTVVYLEELAARESALRIIRNTTNAGFARANNQGMAAARGRYLVLLNNDTLVTAGWLPPLLAHLTDPGVGMVGPVTNACGNESRIAVDYRDPRTMAAFATRYTAEHANQTREMRMLAFFCAALRRDVYEHIGPLDEGFGLGTFEDDDYAMRLALAGYKLLCADDVFVHHWGSASFSRLPSEVYLALFHENRRKFEAKWGVTWQPPVLRRELWQQQARELLESNLWLSRRLADTLEALRQAREEAESRQRESEGYVEVLQRQVSDLTAAANAREEAESRQRESEGYVEVLQRQVSDLTAAAATANAQLCAITSRTAWQVAEALTRLRHHVAPPGSRREVWWHRLLKSMGLWRHHSLSALLGEGRRFLARRLPQRGSGLAASAVPGRATAAAPPAGERIPDLVSVVLPVYNQASLLRASIESVLAQTHPHVELLVINDGSTDGVETVLDDYVAHPKVRVLTQANQTLPKALSNAFEFAAGEFWTWTSADNLMHPDQVARMVAFMRERPDVAMVYADYMAIDDRGEPLTDPSFRPHNRRTPTSPDIHLPRSTEHLNGVQDNFIGPCFMYRATVGRLIGEYAPELGVEDYDYWMRVNSQFAIVHLGTDELLYRYRVHDNTLNARAAQLQIFDRIERLMTHERERTAFYQRPWTIQADGPTLAWLSTLETRPHHLRLFDPSEPVAGWPAKTLLLLHASTLSELTAGRARAGVCTAVWFDANRMRPSSNAWRLSNRATCALQWIFPPQTGWLCCTAAS